MNKELFYQFVLEWENSEQVRMVTGTLSALPWECMCVMAFFRAQDDWSGSFPLAC